MRTKLPVVLENIRIATPCTADWDEMSGDDTVRFCGKCEKNVYNLSSMTREAGEALIRDKEGRLCLRLYQRTDGTVLTADCPVGVRRERLRHRIWTSFTKVAASAALMVGLSSGRARADLCVHTNTKPTSNTKPQRPMMGAVAVSPPEHLMGKIALPPPPPDPKAQKKPQPKMGEPAPIMGGPVMGDIAIETDNKK